MIEPRRFNPLAAALFASAALALMAAAGASCAFLAVVADDPAQGLTAENSTALNETSTTLGIFCPSTVYDLSSDRTARLSHALMVLSILLMTASLVVAWAITTVLPPTLLAWRCIAVLSALSAVFQVPVFLLFQTPPCTADDAEQHCTMDSGSYLLVGAILCSVTVTLITNCLDPPIRVRIVLDTRNVVKRGPDDTRATDRSLSTMSHTLDRSEPPASSWAASLRAFKFRGPIFGSAPASRGTSQRGRPPRVGRHWEAMKDDEEQGFGGASDRFPGGAAPAPRGGPVAHGASASVASLPASVPGNQAQPFYQFMRPEMSSRSFDGVTIVGPDDDRSRPSPALVTVFSSKSVQTRSVDERSIPGRSFPQASLDDLQCHSWEFEEDSDLVAPPMHQKALHREHGLDSSGRDAVVQENDSSYIEDWSREEFVVKVVKREHTGMGASATRPPYVSEQAPVNCSSPTYSVDQTLSRFSEVTSSMLETNRIRENVTNLSSSSASSESEGEPPHIGTVKKPPSPPGRKPDNFHPGSNTWDTSHRTKYIDYHAINEDYENFLEEIRATNAESLDPPPMEMVTVDAYGDGDISMLAIESTMEDEEFATGWNESRRMATPTRAKGIEPSGDLGEEDEVLTSYSDPDLTLDDSLSDHSSDMQMSREKYAHAVVSEVLRRQRRHRRTMRKRKIRSSNSVQSAPSLLDTTIYEETPSDVESEEEKKTEEPYDPYSNASLSRQKSAPNLQCYEGMSSGQSHILKTSQMSDLNDYHRVETWRHPDHHDLRGAGASSSVAKREPRSHATDAPTWKETYRLFKEESIMRKDQRSVLATSHSTEETAEDAFFGSLDRVDPRKVPLWRLRELRADPHTENSSQLWPKSLPRIENPCAVDPDTENTPILHEKCDAESGSKISRSRSYQSLPWEHLSKTLHLSQLEVRKGVFRSGGRKSDPDGVQMTSRGHDASPSLSSEGSI